MYVERRVYPLEELLLGWGQARTPAANDLFKISDTEKQLPKHRSDTFHSLTAQLLFLCKRSRPDIQVAIAFLCTRVQEPTEEDWRKLGRVMKYLMKTKDMFLTLEASDLKQFIILLLRRRNYRSLPQWCPSALDGLLNPSAR